mmetsp:Transcript_15180/g.30724  ORF Transcript_15180/g.30724 Transcript_15180/m.30724 type:complete len:3257 (+) Transcript_15180:52-9822(+)
MAPQLPSRGRFRFIILLAAVGATLLAAFLWSPQASSKEVSQHDALRWFIPLTEGFDPPKPVSKEIYMKSIHPEARRVTLQVDGQGIGETPSFASETQNASTFAIAGTNETDSCISFDERATNPRDSISAMNLNSQSKSVCRLLVYFGSKKRFCTGSMIGSFHVLTARHCTYDPCLGGEATKIRVACEYGYTSDAVNRDYDHSGTAFNGTDVLVFGQYDSTASCVNGQTIRGDPDFDITIFSLDRQYGFRVGWLPLQFPFAAAPSVVTRGFPWDERLNSYFSDATYKQFTRSTRVTNTTATQYIIDNHWSFPGEDGGPLFLRDETSSTLLVNAVNLGGQIGCTQMGRLFETDYILDFAAILGLVPHPSLSQWSTPDPHCSIIRRRSNFDQAYSGPLVRVGLTPTAGSKRVEIYREDQHFYGAVTIYNVGIVDAIVSIAWYASEDQLFASDDEFLGQTPDFRQPSSSHARIASSGEDQFVAGFKATWSGTRYIGAVWRGENADSGKSCLTDDGNQALVGEVVTGCKCADPLSGNNAILCFNQTLSCPEAEECFTDIFVSFSETSRLCRVQQRTPADISAGQRAGSYIGFPRGFAFQAPCDLEISSLLVHGGYNLAQYAMIVRSKSPFGESPAVTVEPEVLWQNGGENSAEDWVAVEVRINKGDYIGIVGYRGTSTDIRNEYSLVSEQQGRFCGMQLEFTRFISQETQYPFSSFSLQSDGLFISRISMNASKATPFPTRSPTPEPTNSPTTLLKPCTIGVEVALGPDNATYRSVGSPPNGNYANGINCYLVVQASELVFTSFDMERGYDFLYIRFGNHMGFTKNESDIALTGAQVPSPIETPGGEATVLFMTDGTVTGEGWRMRTRPFRSAAPTASPTGTPTRPEILVPPGTVDQADAVGPAIELGGPSAPVSATGAWGYRGTSIEDTEVTCFYNETAYDPNGFYPWLSNRIDQTNHVADTLTFDSVNINFEWSGDGSLLEQCRELRVRNLVVTNSIITSVTTGFRLFGSSSVLLDNVTITHPEPFPRWYGQVLFSASGARTQFTVMNSIIEKYYLYEAAFKLDVNEVEFEFVNNDVVNIFGSRFTRGLEYLPEGVSVCTNCSSACFDTSNYCQFDDSSWTFHSFGFIDASVSNRSKWSFRIESNRFSEMDGFVGGQILNLDTSKRQGCSSPPCARQNNSVIIRDISIIDSIPRDRSLDEMLNPTSSPSLSPPTASPSLAPTRKKQLIGVTNAPTAHRTSSPTASAPDTELGPFIAAIAAFKGEVGSIILDDLFYDRNFDPSSESTKNRRSLLAVNALASRIVVTNVNASDGVLDAVVHYQSSQPPTGGGNIEVKNLVMDNIFSKVPSYRAVLYIEDSLAAAVNLEQVSISQSDHSLVYCLSEDPQQQYSRIRVQNVQVSTSKPYFRTGVSGKQATSGLIALWAVPSAGTFCQVEVEDSSFNDVELGVALMDVACTNVVLNLTRTTANNLLRATDEGQQSIALLSQQIETGYLYMKDVRVNNSESGLARVLSQQFMVNVSGSRLSGFHATAIRIKDNVGSMSMENTKIMNSSSPVVYISSNKPISLTNRQTFTTMNSEFVRNSGTGVGPIQSASGNGYIIAKDCDFAHNTALNNLDEDQKARGDLVFSSGGAIISRGEVHVDRCHFFNNSAYNGGAIFADTLIVRGSTFSQNSAEGNAGDITAPFITAEDCSFTASRANIRGGSIWVPSSGGAFDSRASFVGTHWRDVASSFGSVMYFEPQTSTDIFNSSIFRASSKDSAFFLSDTAELRFSEGTISGITSQDAGMLHLTINSKATLSNLSYSDAAVTGFGGLAFAEANSKLLIDNCTFRNLSAEANGGAVYIRGAHVQVNDSSFKNLFAVTGGVSYILGGTLRFVRTTIEDVRSKTGGVLNGLVGSETEFDGCMVRNCNAEVGAIARLVSDAQVLMKHSVVREFQAEESAGVMMLSDTARATFVDTELQKGNAAGVGILHLIGSSSVTLLRVNASGVKADDSGIQLNGNSSLDARSCFFENNRIIKEGAVITVDDIATASLSDCSFIGNKGKEGASVVGRAFSFVAIKNGIYKDNTATDIGPAVLSSSRRGISITGSTFLRNEAGFGRQGQGGAIFTLSPMNISSSTFIQNKASQGGAIGTETSMLEVENCTFTRNRANNDGGAIAATASSLFIRGSRFDTNNAGLLGGAIYIVNTTRLSIETTTFISNSVEERTTGDSSKGGALAIAVTMRNTSIEIGGGTRFEANVAPGGAGGAVYWDIENSKPSFAGVDTITTLDEDAALIDPNRVIFLNNQAQQGDDVASAPFEVEWGGESVSIDPNSPLATAINVTIRDFYNELVVGDVFLRLLALPLTNETGEFEAGRLTTRTGSACFGTKCSDPISTRFISPPDNNFTFAVEATAQFFFDDGSEASLSRNSTQTVLVVRTCKPGQVVEGTECIDCDVGTYQPAIPDDNSQCIPCPAGNYTAETGSATCPLCEGYTPTTSECKPCSDDPNAPEVPNDDLDGCVLCTENTVKGRYWECLCSQGFFAYTRDYKGRNPSKCTGCPEGGSCPVVGMTEHEVQPEEGFWLSPWDTENLEFIECVNDACIGERGQCDDGYRGVLCTECEDGYGRSEEFECEECNSFALVIVGVIGTWLLVIFIAIIITAVSVTEAENVAEEEEDEEKPETDASTLIKILLNFLQFNTVAASFNYEWPSFVRGLLESEAFISASLDSLINVDCVVGSDPSVRPYYINTMIIAGLPLIIPLLALITALIFTCCKNKSIKKAARSVTLWSMIEQDSRQPSGNLPPSSFAILQPPSRITSLDPLRGTDSQTKPGRYKTPAWRKKRDSQSDDTMQSNYSIRSQPPQKHSNVSIEGVRVVTKPKVRVVTIKEEDGQHLKGDSKERGDEGADLEAGINAKSETKGLSGENSKDPKNEIVKEKVGNKTIKEEKKEVAKEETKEEAKEEAKTESRVEAHKDPRDEAKKEDSTPKKTFMERKGVTESKSAASESVYDSKKSEENSAKHTQKGLEIDEDPELVKELTQIRRGVHFYTACLSLMFMLYPTLVDRAFSLFSCEQLTDATESNRFLPDMGQQCWTGEHLVYSLALGIPMLVFYVIGFPLLLLYLLYKHKPDFPANWDNLSDLNPLELFVAKRRSMHLHMLYDSFKDDFYYFEILILVRKALVVIIAVFIVSPQAQTQFAILLICVAVVVRTIYFRMSGQTDLETGNACLCGKNRCNKSMIHTTNPPATVWSSTVCMLHFSLSSSAASCTYQTTDLRSRYRCW